MDMGLERWYKCTAIQEHSTPLLWLTPKGKKSENWSYTKCIFEVCGKQLLGEFSNFPISSGFIRIKVLWVFTQKVYNDLPDSTESLYAYLSMSITCHGM